MRVITLGLVLSSMLLSAATFGFFYAWICSTMWGLDMADPRVAIQAMQAMNASVRNAVFAPAFFGTPFVVFLTAAVLWAQRYRKSAALFALSGVVYFCFAMLLTMMINVPMNEALAAIPAPNTVQAAQQIWQDYSPTWQFWNQLRTVTSGTSFLMLVVGVLYLPILTRQQ